MEGQMTLAQEIGSIWWSMLFPIGIGALYLGILFMITIFGDHEEKTSTILANLMLSKILSAIIIFVVMVMVAFHSQSVSSFVDDRASWPYRYWRTVLWPTVIISFFFSLIWTWFRLKIKEKEIKEKEIQNLPQGTIMSLEKRHANGLM